MLIYYYFVILVQWWVIMQVLSVGWDVFSVYCSSQLCDYFVSAFITKIAAQHLGFFVFGIWFYTENGSYWRQLWYMQFTWFGNSTSNFVHVAITLEHFYGLIIRWGVFLLKCVFWFKLVYKLKYEIKKIEKKKKIVGK